ncbi:MAG: glycoside hydrolase family 140 protein [Oscillospiraceae bacterium]|nr:glycoside hydrolase family 140 protein [Oscillospiraceae bacterium]
MGMGYLRVGESGRCFMRDGRPFFWMGDTIWPAVSWYTIDELKAYFAKRREQGFTVAHIMLPWTMFDGSEESRKAQAIPDELPLWHNDDPASPNEAYFEKLDEVIGIAADHGILLTILPNGGGSGTHVDYKKIITMDNVRAYGKWLGRRYRDEPNIVWVNGFDLLPWLYEDIAREFNAGLMEEDGGKHLIFYHPCGGASSNHFHSEEWLAANFIQTWSDMYSIQGMVAADYHRRPPKPVVHVEGAYEAGTEYTTAPITSWHVREQAYWSYLSGGFHTYGHNDLWRKTPHWRDALDARGAWQMKVLKDVFESVEWWRLVPDQRMIKPLFKHGHVAARSADAGSGANGCAGGFALIYYAHRSTLSVDMYKVGGGAPVSAEWIDPQNGERLGKTVYTDAVCRITSPARCDDALLLLRA